MFYSTVLYLLEQNNTLIKMSSEAWVAVGIFVIGGIVSFISLWNKTTKEIGLLKASLDVMKEEYRTLKSMVDKLIDVDRDISKTLADLGTAIARLEGKLDSKQDK